MRTVLGIDAAWTTTQPAGVALVQGSGARWKCLMVAPSYTAFVAASNGAAVDWSSSAMAGAPQCGAILDAAIRLAGRKPDVIAVDMPLSTQRITGRRVADDAISSEFGHRWCGTHSPNRDRPGRIADMLRDGFGRLGFPLRCVGTRSGSTPSLIEVYPHTALLTLLDAECRVRYKTGKTKTYWKDLSLRSRRLALLTEWDRILGALSKRIGRVAMPIPRHEGPIAGLKRFEDGIDALICCWMGVEYLAGRAVPFGDACGAIWT